MSAFANILTKLFSFSLIAIFAFSLVVAPSVSAASSTAANGTVSLPSRSELCGSNCPVTGSATGSQFLGTNGSQNNIATFILNIAKFLTYIAGAVAVLFLVYGGFLIIVDNGDEARSKKGKKILFNALYGLIITIIAYTIVNFISGLTSTNITGLFGGTSE